MSATSRFAAIDLTYHLRAGAAMLADRALMDSDRFTFTAAGARWLNQQWLAQVIMAGVLDAGGWLALAALRALLVGLVAWLVMQTARARGADERGAAWLALASAALTLPALGLRPQLFGAACFALSAWLLFGHQARPGRLWLLVPVAACWANVHGTFPLLFVLGGAALLEDVVTRGGRWRLLSAVGVTALAATLVNPHGGEIWAYVAGLTSNPFVTSSVDEWQRPSFSSWSGAAFLASIPLVVLAMARSRARAPWPLTLALGGFLLLGLMATRGILWWGLFAPVVLASGMAAAAVTLPTARSLASTALAWTFVLLAAAGLGRWLPWRSAAPVPSRLISAAPPGVTDALLRVLAPGDRIFNAQVWGSWFEYALPANPVAVDSRIELIPASVWEDYGRVSRADEGWREVLDAWDVRALAVSAVQQPHLLLRLEDDAVWMRVHGDADGAVFARR